MQRTLASSRRRGFTLIEMLVVVALIGILALGVIPSVIQIISRQQTRSFSQTSVSVVNFARLRAIRGGRPVHVFFETRDNVKGEPRTMIRAMVDTDQDGVGDDVINRTEVPGPIKLAAPPGLDIVDGFEVLEGTAASPVLAQIVFNTDGSVQRTGSIRYGDLRGNLLELAVGPSRAVGRVSVRKWDGLGYHGEGDGPHDWTWQ